MPFTTGDLLTMNRQAGGNGNWMKPACRISAEGFLTSVAAWDLGTIVRLATMITTGQWFNGGNHRTALLVIHFGTIDDLGWATKAPTYQLYAKLDYSFYRAQQGPASSEVLEVDGTSFDPDQSLFDFLTSRGKIQRPTGAVRDPSFWPAIRATKLVEVQNLPAELGEITRHRNFDQMGSEQEWQARQQMKGDASYQRNKTRMKIFRALNGGSLLHSSHR